MLSQKSLFLGCGAMRSLTMAGKNTHDIKMKSYDEESTFCPSSYREGSGGPKRSAR